MAEGRLRQSWDQTSLLWVAIAEPNRDQTKCPKPFTAYDVHPYRDSSEQKKSLPSVTAAKHFFKPCPQDEA